MEQNKQLVRRLLEEDLSPVDEAVAAAIIHPDFIDYTNPPGMQHGLAGHLAIARLFRAAFPVHRWQIDDLLAEGDRVAVRATMTGTHAGELFGIPPTGRPVRVSGVHILRIAEGQIAEHWGTNDDLGLLRQLGALPAPDAVATP